MSLVARLDVLGLPPGEDLVRLHLGTEAIGLVRRPTAAWIAAHPRHAAWIASRGPRDLHVEAAEAGVLSDRFAALADDLHRAGLVPAWRNEPYAIVSPRTGRPAFEIERGVVDVLGLPSAGTHLDAYVEGPDGTGLWMARRARTKPTFPGVWDHIAAGGLPAGLAPRANMVKEAGEEAGIAPFLLERMVEVGVLAYRAALPWGVRQDTLHLYAVELPPSFVPTAADGEVESFALFPLAEAIALLEGDAPIKFNVGPAMLATLQSQGALAGHPEADAVARRLAGPDPVFRAR